MKKGFIKILKGLLIVYIVICGLLYFFQEKLIFFPEKLSKDYQFNFQQKFEEIPVKTEDNTLLNGILFITEDNKPKGLIFYLHGNAGSLKGWGNVAETYTSLGYDVFILDYRGYGKSEGKIKNQEQMFSDIQTAYNKLKSRFNEKDIIVLGYSIGTGPAAKIASTNHPKMLILQAPYFSLSDMMKHYYPILPTFLLKYKFDTNIYLKECKAPVVIFHGNRDQVIYYESSLKLKQNFNSRDNTLITLNGQGHNNMTDNPEYKIRIKKNLQ